jgi:hypothetical protein
MMPPSPSQWNDDVSYCADVMVSRCRALDGNMFRAYELFSFRVEGL